MTPFFDEFTGQYPRPGIDKDIADGHEGFVEVGGNLHNPHPGWDVIVGRQEVILGTGRLLDDNEGVNVRSAFDGVRIGYDKPAGRIDLIAVKPVEINPGAWDDRPNPTITFWGLYASNLRWSQRFMSDVYFLDYDAKSATYSNQSAREQRRMIGGRYFITCLASRPGQVLITTSRLGSSGALSGIARSVHGPLEGISGGRFPVSCGARVSVYRPTPSAETTASRLPWEHLTRYFREELISGRSSR